MPFFDETIDGLDRRARSGAHDHHHRLGIGRAVIFEEPVPATGLIGQLVHGADDDRRDQVVEGVCRFPRLEEHIRVLGRTPEHGAVWIESSQPMGSDQILVDQPAEDGVADSLDLGDLVGRPEPVEEMEKGHPRFERGQVGDEGEVVGFLDRARGEHGEPGLPGPHHVGVVAEYGEGMGGDRPRGDMNDHRR